MINRKLFFSLISFILILSLMPVPVQAASVEVDYMEYSTDALAQAAYVTNGVYGNTGGSTSTVGANTLHTFSSNANFTPNKAGTVGVEAWGAGGGGGYSNGKGGGGGGGGAYAATPNVSVTAGTNYAVVRGTGGARDAAGVAGSSTFAATTVVALGGTGVNGEIGGAGGAGASGTGTTKNSGGAGKNAHTDSDVGGGGGGAAGPDGVGRDGVAAASNAHGDGGAGDFSSGGAGGTTAGQNGADNAKGGGGGAGSGDTDGQTGGLGGTPGGGGGGTDNSGAGGTGGNGQVVVTCVTADYLSLQAYKESTIVNQGTYSLKGVATTAANGKTLTRTIASPINLTGVNYLSFSIYSSRTGSNIKLGIHDAGGTTTETTPNVTGASAWQAVTWDISAVSNANKDAIDSIIITIVDATSANTFYVDGFATLVTATVETHTPATSIEATTAYVEGHVTDAGGGTVSDRGICYDTSTNPTTASSHVHNGTGTGTFNTQLTSLLSGTTYHTKAFAINGAGTSYGDEVDFLTKPGKTATPTTSTNSATEILVSWTLTTGADNYHVYRAGADLGEVGNVDHYHDTGAPAPLITAGTTVATEDQAAHVDLSLSGTSVANGANTSYTVMPQNATGDGTVSDASANGYRLATALGYQWRRAASVYPGTDYSDIGGATSSTYEDSSIGAPLITVGSTVATEDQSAHVDLSLSGTSVANGERKNYVCTLTSAGASNTPATSGANDGYRLATALGYQWRRAASVYPGVDYADIGGATSSTYEDTGIGAPLITAGSAVASDGTDATKVSLSLSGTSVANGERKNYVCTLTSTGASNSPGTSVANDGYRLATALSYQWQRSSGTGDSGYGDITGATASTYDDTGGAAPLITVGTTVASDGSSSVQTVLSLSGTSVANGAIRYYKCTLTSTGASNSPVSSGSNDGYRIATALGYQWQRSSGTGDSDYGDIGGATASTYNDAAAPAPSITVGSAVATDGTDATKVSLSLSGSVAVDGAVRYYKCTLTSTGASNSPAASVSNDGYRGATALTYQWKRSDADADSDYNTNVSTAASYDDTGAPAPLITAGAVVATDGSFSDKVSLSLSGTSVADGAGRYYTCTLVSTNASNTPQTTAGNRGYRGATALSYQWKRSDADSAANYNTNLGTSSTYDDAAAPAPLITIGTTVATDGTYSDKVSLSLSGTSVADGAGRYFVCTLTSAGASNTPVDATANRGYRVANAITYQWQRSSGTGDSGYGDIGGATSSTYDDTGGAAPIITPGSSVATDGTYSDKVALSLSGTSIANGEVRYYKCTLTSTDASNSPTASVSNSGYRVAASLTYQWQRSDADSDADYNTNLCATAVCNDTTITIGAKRYYRCVLNATGSAQQISSANEGYRKASGRSFGIIVGG